MPTLPAEIDSALDYFLEICPGKDERCRRLYEGAVENGGLLATDFYTLRDWLETAEYETHLSLHALLILLLLALDEGSLCLEQSEATFRRRLEAIVSEEDARFWSVRLMKDLTTKDYSALISDDGDAGKPLIRDEIQGHRFLFFQKFYRHERNVRDAFMQRLTTGLMLPCDTSAARMPAILKDVLQERPLLSRGKPIDLDADQLTALGVILLRPLVIVSGGPGTGKTSLVMSVLRCLSRCGISAQRIALAAPTGRAAQRLGDSIRSGIGSLGESASTDDRALQDIVPLTLHQLLGYNPNNGQYRRHQESPVPADVVIVDEVSMVGLTLMGQLLQALAPQTRLVLLGDKDQLPSVDAGAVLSHLIPGGLKPSYSVGATMQLTNWFPFLSLEATQGGLFDQSLMQDSIALLQKNHRSERRIQQAALSIQKGDASVLETLSRQSVLEIRDNDAAWNQLALEGGCHLLESASGSPKELEAVLRRWARYCLQEAATDRGGYVDLVSRCRLSAGDEYDEVTQAELADLFMLVERNRLLTLVRDGAWGCDGINSFLHGQLQTLHRRKRSQVEPGSPILITQNDHVRQLSNGDVGLALQGAGGDIRVVFRRRNGFTSFPFHTLPPHELGFALTVHKSQGSEYDHVLLVFPPEGARRLLTRELVYTAITRARRLAVLFGKEEVIRTAIENHIDREAGWLRTLHGTG